VFSGYTLFQPAWKFLLWRWALAALVIGWLDPKMGSQLEEVESEGVDLMVAVDVSNSMLAEDVGMPRLDLAKRTVERLMAQTAGDRIGLVVFAGEAYVQCPIDHRCRGCEIVPCIGASWDGLASKEQLWAGPSRPAGKDLM
jgi:hypothetical protein